MCEELKVVGVDLGLDNDVTICTEFVNGSVIENYTIKTDNNIRGKRSKIFLVSDKLYDKYLKRVENRQKYM